MHRLEKERWMIMRMEEEVSLGLGAKNKPG